MATAPASRSRLRESFVDAEQPALLRTLRRCSIESDYARWESVRGELAGLGYRVVVVKGVEHLRALAS